MNIAGREIGQGHSPYVIGEISGEHRGSFEKAKALILALKDAGADAAKLQCFDPIKLAEARGGAGKVLTEGLWAGRTLGDLYRETHTPRGWFPELFAYAKDIGITLFSSVFDEDGLDYLELLRCPAYKIASREATDFWLASRAIWKGRPVIVSTGTATDQELGRSIMPGLDRGAEIAVLYCVSEYPTPIEAVRFEEIEALRKRYFIPIDVVGFSDHTVGIEAAVRAANEYGASIIEKHITLSRENGGPDKAFSLEPAEFKQMVQEIRNAS